MKQIITRVDAKARGLKKYFTGLPCKCGHLAERYVSDCSCTGCFDKEKISARRKREYVENKEKILSRNQAYYEINRASIISQKREYNEKRKEERALRDKAHYVVNGERLRAEKRAYRAANLEKVRALEKARRDPEKIKKYIKDNKERYATYARNRKRKLRSRGRHTTEELNNIIKAQGYKCAYCRASLRKTRYEVDHIMPIALGGSNLKENLQMLCMPCNRKKYAKHPIAFAQELGLLL